jgi:hypothetical protein
MRRKGKGKEDGGAVLFGWDCLNRVHINMRFDVNLKAVTLGTGHSS